MPLRGVWLSLLVLEVLVLEAASSFDQGLAARRKLLLLVLISLLSDLPASQRCTEGQTRYVAVGGLGQVLESIPDVLREL